VRTPLPPTAPTRPPNARFTSPPARADTSDAAPAAPSPLTHQRVGGSSGGEVAASSMKRSATNMSSGVVTLMLV